MNNKTWFDELWKPIGASENYLTEDERLSAREDIKKHVLARDRFEVTPDKRVEEVQQSIKNLLHKAHEKNWKNGGVSIYDLSDLQEASDRVITQYHQDMMNEVVGKIEQSKRKATSSFVISINDALPSFNDPESEYIERSFLDALSFIDAQTIIKSLSK